MNPTPLIDNLKPDWRLLLPAIRGDLCAYNREKLRADLTAAVTVTLVSVPQILGFALVLGLPPTLVLTCAIVGAFVSALFSPPSC